MNEALFRQGTSDRNVWESVAGLANEYRLPDKFNSNDLILDIGGNIGAFTYACIQRGAGKVIAFEPDPDNFAIFRKQLKKELFNGLVEVYPLAVVGGSGFSWRTFSGVVRSDGQINHGGAFLFGEDGQDWGLSKFIVNSPFRVPCIGMDAVHGLIEQDHPSMVKRFLKLDCEGGEWEILPGSYVSEWQQIGGEYHPNPERIKEDVNTFLKPDGFKVELAPHPNSEMGLFFASK